jgi:phage/plasmid-associated DNA primase
VLFLAESGVENSALAGAGQSGKSVFSAVIERLNRLQNLAADAAVADAMLLTSQACPEYAPESLCVKHFITRLIIAW